jgi:TonB-dependent receptor
MKLQINFCEACVAPFWRHSCVTVGWKNRGIPLHGYLTMNTRKLSICTAVSLANALFVANAVQAQDGSDSERIEEVYVYGQRAMMEGAIQRQRDSDQIMSVITRDAIGNFPDQNVAESVRRLSGVNVLNDQGEGRFIAVRGLDPGLNSSSVNGVRLPSPEAGTRAVALDVIASELVESIEVVKTLTPDLNADTIGAAINIATTRAFDVEEPFLSIKGEQQYNDLAEAWSPKAVVDFMYPVNERFGIAGGLSWQDREFSTDNVEADGWDVTDGGIAYADTIEYRDYDVVRERTSGSLSVDFQATDSTVLYARAMYSLFEDTESRRALIMEMDEEPSDGDSNSARFLSGDGEIAFEREQKDRYEAQEIRTFSVGGETNLENWDFDYMASYAYSEEHEKDTQDPTTFAAGFEDPGALGIAFDYSDRDLPRYSIFEGADAFFDPTTYEFDGLEVVDALAEDEEITLKFDAARHFRLNDGELEVKFGASLRQRTKESDTRIDVYDGFDGDYTLADVLGRQSYGLIDVEPTSSVGRVRAFNNANFDRFEFNQFDTDVESNIGDFSMDEDITAGYLMGTWRSNAWTVIGGVRVEDTENEVRANRTEIFEEGAELDGVVLEDDTVVITPTSDTNSYTNWLPSLSLRLNATDDLVMRAGFFSSVVRPNPEQLAPIFVVEESGGGDREGEFGNPDLDPYEAFNVDASVEWYFADASVLSGGVFYKDIENFIFNTNFDADTPPFNGVYNGIAFTEAVIPQNGESAEVLGFEVNYQQVMSFLPAPFNGLLLGLNYTYTDAEGDTGERVIPLPAAAENTFNAMLGYESDRISLRLTAAYRDSYLDELGGDPDEDRYVEDHLQIDLTANFDVTDSIKIYSQFINLNDEPYVAYQNGPSRQRLLQYEEYSWTGRIGVQVTF